MIVAVPDASEATGVPASTIRRWLAEGRIVRRVKRGRVSVSLPEVRELAALLGRNA